MADKKKAAKDKEKEKLHQRIAGISEKAVTELSGTLAKLRVPHLLGNNDFIWSDEQLEKIQAFRVTRAKDLIEQDFRQTAQNGQEGPPSNNDVEKNDTASEEGPPSSNDVEKNETAPEVAAVAPIQTSASSSSNANTSATDDLQHEEMTGLTSEVAGGGLECEEIVDHDPAVEAGSTAARVSTKSSATDKGLPETKKGGTADLPGFGDFFTFFQIGSRIQSMQTGKAPAPRGSAFADKERPFRAASTPCRLVASQARKTYRAPSRVERHARTAHEGNSMSLQAHLEARNTSRSSRLCCKPGAGRDLELRLSGVQAMPAKLKYFTQQWDSASESNRRPFSTAAQFKTLTPSCDLLESEVTCFLDA